MTMHTKYTKGSNTGYIADNGKNDNLEFVAVAAGGSKWFKTFKGAENWIIKTMGYSKA